MVEDGGQTKKDSFSDLQPGRYQNIKVSVEMLHLDKTEDGMGFKARDRGIRPQAPFSEWDSLKNVDAEKNDSGGRIEFSAELPSLREVCAFPSRTGVIKEWKDSVEFSTDMHATEQIIFMTYVFYKGKSTVQKDFQKIFSTDAALFNQKKPEDEPERYSIFDDFLDMWKKRMLRPGCSEILIAVNEQGQVDSYYVDGSQVYPKAEKTRKDDGASPGKADSPAPEEA